MLDVGVSCLEPVVPMHVILEEAPYNRVHSSKRPALSRALSQKRNSIRGFEEKKIP